MQTEKFVLLKKSYSDERAISLTDEQFSAVLYTIPSLIIAGADGKIDDYERTFIREIPSGLLSAYRHHHYRDMVTDEFKEAYFSEIQYLMIHLPRWQDTFIAALKDELNQKLNDKNIIYEMMWQTASSSQDVGENEIRRIKQLSKVLFQNDGAE